AKYAERDRRINKTQLIEFDFLAPDSVNEMFTGMQLMKEFTGKAYAKMKGKSIKETEFAKTGEKLLEANDVVVDKLNIEADGFENAKRPAIIQKALSSYHIFKNLVIYYGVSQLIEYAREHKIPTLQALLDEIPQRNKRNN